MSIPHAQEIAQALVDWFTAHGRDYPWRRTTEPWAILVSEIMLQQTTIPTVLRRYEGWMAQFPTPASLAAATEEEALRSWEGLGYYRRARNLHKGAQQVAAEYGGVIPRDVKELLKISGIGEYTAGAIASIAYDQVVPAVDGNVIRVVSRVKGIRENVGIPSVKRRIAQEAAALVPQSRPGDFNQAMMDLGATICVPGTPSCERCPVAALCDAYREGDAEDIPELPRKNPPRVIDYDLCLIFNGDRVLMRQRTETMLQGLWVYPMVEEHHTVKQLPAIIKRKIGLPVTDVQAAGEAKHIFTHQVWQMKLYTMQTTAEAPTGWRFVTLEEMEGLTIPTAVKKAKDVVIRNSECGMRD